jgi:hypothetical protein
MCWANVLGKRGTARVPPQPAVQIPPMNASVSDMINLAAFAVHDAIEDQAESMPQVAE